MKYKKGLIFICLIICLFSIASVCASDINETTITDENISQTELMASYDDLENNNGEIQKIEQNELIIGEEDSGTFTELQNKIDNAKEGSIITLKNNYTYDDGFTSSGIKISKRLTIEGNGYTINANSQSRIFSLSGRNIVLKNMIFINADSSNSVGYGYGGAIYNSGRNNSINSCTFSNCTARSYGGGIYNTGIDCNINSCNFTNMGNKYRGAIYNNAANCNINSCTFINCSAKDSAGAIYNNAANCTIKLCNFIKCTSDYHGGTIYNNGGANFTIIYCTFTNCSAKDTGGAVFNIGSNTNCIVKFCTFTNCSAPRCAGDIYSEYSVCSAINCIFIGGRSCYNTEFITLIDPHLIVNIANFEKNSVGLINIQTNSSYFGEVSVNIVNTTLTYKIKVEYGYGNITIENLKVGNYTAIANLIGDNTFEDSVINTTFEVIKIKTYDINIPSIVDNIDNNLTISLPFDATGNVTITINNVDYNAAFVNNQAIINLSSLISGNYTYYFIYSGDGNYSSFTTIGDLTINKKRINPEIINFPLDNISVNESVIITLPTNAKGNVTLTINSIDYLFNVTNGIANITIPNLNYGDYEYNITYSGDERYDSCNATGILTIIPAKSSLVINHVNATVGHKTTLIANVTSKVIINEGIVTFFDGDINIGESNVNNGIATLTYTPYLAGEHTITAKFSSNNYLCSNSTAKLMVDSATIEVLVDNGTVGFNSTLIVNVKGLYSIIDEGTISLYVDNKFVNKVDVIKGSATLYYIPLMAKNYVVKTIFSDSVNFLTEENTTVFTVKKANSQVIVNDVEGKVTHSVILTAYINSSNNLTINEGVISFLDGDINIGESNVNNGMATLTYTPTTVGEHAITAIFNSDDYLNSNGTAKLLVDYVTVNANDMIVDYNNDYDFIATFFKADGTSLANSYVIFTLNGKDYIVKTDSNGIAILDIGLCNGVYNITSTNILTGESINNVLTIIGEPVQILNMVISAYDITTAYNGGKYLVATLKDINGKPVEGVQVSINLNGVKYLTTDKNGQVKLSTNGLAPNTYTATITFAGNTNHDKSTTTAKVTVKKATPKLTANKKTFKKSVKTKKYTITLKDNQNKVMKNTKVTIKVNKKTYTAKTNAKGKATFKITKLTKKGKYNAMVTYKGNKYYNKVTKKTKIIVK